MELTLKTSAGGVLVFVSGRDVAEFVSVKESLPLVNDVVEENLIVFTSVLEVESDSFSVVCEVWSISLVVIDDAHTLSDAVEMPVLVSLVSSVVREVSTA